MGATSSRHNIGGENTSGVHPQTPTRMLENYIGPGRYRPAAAKETHSPAFLVWVAVSAIALMGLAMWLTIWFLTR